MPGDYWKKFAGLRAFYGYWMSHPGKKLLFMGGEFGQFIEWKFDDSLDWHLLDYPAHQEMQRYVKALNLFYNQHPEFWQVDYNWQGFNWISCDDNDNSVISFYRKGVKPEDQTIVVCNFTPEVRRGYRIGVEEPGTYKVIFNSDDSEFGGSGEGNKKPVLSDPVACHGKEQSITLTLPPLAVLYIKYEKPKKRKTTKRKAKGNVKVNSKESTDKTGLRKKTVRKISDK
jgi:1,4-alpha-glucan branching enzyme